MKCQSLFSREKNKKYTCMINLSSSEIAQRVVKVKLIAG